MRMTNCSWGEPRVTFRRRVVDRHGRDVGYDLIGSDPQPDPEEGMKIINERALRACGLRLRLLDGGNLRLYEAEGAAPG